MKQNFSFPGKPRGIPIQSLQLKNEVDLKKNNTPPISHIPLTFSVLFQA